MFNVAAASETRLRHVDELKQKLSDEEEKSSTLSNELNVRTTKLERRSAEVEEWKAQVERLATEVGTLEARKIQSDQRLKAAEDLNLEKDRELAVLREEKNEAVRLLQARLREVMSLRSPEYKESIIANYQKSERYESELDARAAPFFDKRAAHIIRQLHPLISDKNLLVEAYDNHFAADACKKGAAFVPIAEDDLEEIRRFDAEQDLPELVPPTPVHPTFWELRDATAGGAAVEVAVVDSVGADRPEVRDAPAPPDAPAAQESNSALEE